MKTKKNIILTGAQGTGKTTVLKLFSQAHPEYSTITEVVRNLAKTDKVSVNENGDIASQRKIFSTYCNLLSQNGFISDRGLTDVMSYTDWVADEKTDDADGMAMGFEFVREEKILRDYNNTHDVLYVYFPIEFSVEDDGFRSTSESFRRSIDKRIKHILEKNKIKYITVHGTPEERLKQIEDALS